MSTNAPGLSVELMTGLLSADPSGLDGLAIRIDESIECTLNSGNLAELFVTWGGDLPPRISG